MARVDACGRGFTTVTVVGHRVWAMRCSEAEIPVGVAGCVINRQFVTHANIAQ